jgi:hypothetical protein
VIVSPTVACCSQYGGGGGRVILLKVMKCYLVGWWPFLAIRGSELVCLNAINTPKRA